MTTCDVVVVGAGPAGASVARELARRGLATVLVDRRSFPRDKVCGACLHPRAIQELAAAGLTDLVAGLGARPLERVALVARGRRRAVALPPGGVVVSRARFDAALVDEARRAGALVWLGTAASPESADADVRVVRVGERVVTASAVVAADGLGGAFLRRAGELDLAPRRFARVGLGARLAADDGAPRDGTVELAVARAGYVGRVRLEDGAIDVAAAVDPRALAARGPTALVAGILAEAGATHDARALESAEWHGTPPLWRRDGPVGVARAFAVGDAAGYAEPFSGEGISWALAGARLLAPIVADLCRGRTSADDARARWCAAHRAALGPRRRASLSIASLARFPSAVGTLLSASSADAAWLRAAVARAWGRSAIGASGRSPS